MKYNNQPINSLLSNTTMLNYLINLIGKKIQLIILLRLKIYLLLKVDELLHLPDSLICIEFIFYLTKSIQECRSVLNLVYLSTQYSFSFLRRRKLSPLDIIICVTNTLSLDNKQIHRARFDEDSALERSYKFNKLLVTNNIQMEITSE